MNIIPMYDRFLYCWFVHVNIEPSLVVGWFEVELMRNLRFLWSVLCEEGVRAENCHNRVDCGPCVVNGQILPSCDMQCMNVLCVNPVPPMCYVILCD